MKLNREKARRVGKAVLIGLGVALVIAQFVPVDRANPPVETVVSAPAEVVAVLERACYDCHSNEVVWPAYSRVAPISWLVAYDIHEGREAVNYSTWGRYSVEERAKLREETWEEVEEGEMPLRLYSLLHPDTRLTDPDRELLRAWALGAEGDDSFERETESEH